MQIYMNNGELHSMKKRHGKFSKVLLQQDNARVHNYKVSMDAEERNWYEIIFCLFA